ncbi:hydroxyacid dehydrogenase [Sediminibacillus massiliensis]|uniref:hydroxyacid dehydrogenase n=1 Tax=Sediminibacillus massiliensis TaxID=1926277 RepID=UPI0009888485|nr:hydroxyacid dehydrogenase [Sediminibacillus massiliensis]
MERFKVLLPQPVAEEGIRCLQAAGCEAVHADGTDEHTLIKAVQDCDAILVRTARITRQIIESADKLKVIARHGVGLDNVNIAAASERGIYVCNAPTANIHSVAEHVLGLMIAVSHFIPAADKALRRGDFATRNYFIGNELLGKTVGLIGCGNIGKLVAQKCALGLGMKVIAFDPNINRPEQDFIEMVSTVEEVLRRADYVSLHLPYSPELHHFIHTYKLKLMKSSAYLINAARGGLVDEQALYDALVSKSLAGAALDCFEKEPPLPNHPLWELENVVVTPHMAAHTKEAMIRMAMIPAEEIIRVKNGKQPNVWINRDLFKEGEIHH